ncbi:hypothetical protein [Borreliella yangtzensis]|uniref:Uncharacterized protein n=1 Tax=Borreliella yangtzensis TaxID=683292 RepID=A0ABR6PBV7_9SPIR|nr:hypothetical protein [Borreliella yangtzensis]
MKKFIFKKLHEKIIEENSEKIDPNFKEISSLRLSSHIGRKEIEYQRLLKVSWFLEKKYIEYQKTMNSNNYLNLTLKQDSEIVNNVNCYF